MKQYMLDTNTVSHLIRQHPGVTQRIITVPITSLSISAITEGELQFGLAKRPHAKRLHVAVGELLRRLDVLPWNSTTAQVYGELRADLERLGQTLAPLDMLIAAHALAVGATLVTSDRAFSQVKNITIEDWTQ